VDYIVGAQEFFGSYKFYIASIQIESGENKMSKSKIYKELTNEEIHSIVIDLYGTNTLINYYNILKGGLFNTTYFIKTDKDINPIVVRVAPVNQHLLFEFEKDMMSAETLFHELLREKNIPTSKILKHVPKGDIIDREYIISEYLNSVPMNDLSIKEFDLQGVYEEVGSLTRLIHTITNEKFGWKRKTGWGEYEKWSDFVLSFAKEATDKAEVNSLFDQSDIRKFRNIFNENVNILDEVTKPYMIHTDLWQGNILLKQSEGRYKVAGIIDLDRTIFGDKYWDLSNPWMINNAFLRGYNESLPETTNYKMRCYIYKLLAGLFGTYVWLIEYDDKEKFEKEKENTQELLNKY